MELKTVDVGGTTYAELRDGKPVYIGDDGKEIAFDYAHTLGTLSRLRGEAKTNRERAEEAESRVKLFDGIDDPETARHAIETVKNLDSKRLFDAGKVEEIKAEAKRAYDEQIKAARKEIEPVIAERDALKTRLDNEIIGGSFNRSKFITEKLAIPADLVQARFGNAFTLDGDKIVAKDASGNPIYSRSKPGDIAGFDEALEILVDAYPNRDSILKGSGASGSGAQGSGTVHGGKRTMSRTVFDQLDPAAKAAAVREATIVD